MRTLTLLLLSGGGLTGSNIMACLADRRAGLRLVATSDAPDEPALFNFDAVYLAPRLADAAAPFEQRILDIVERERVDLVVPCRDEDVQWLAGLGARRTDLAPKFLCGSPRVAEIANDKWLSFQFCQERALPFVPSLLCGESADLSAFVAQHGFPLVAKPRHGVASNGILLLVNHAQAMRAMTQTGYVLQKFLGDPKAVDGYLQGLEQEGVPLSTAFRETSVHCRR